MSMIEFDSFVDFIKNNDFYIFGTGGVAHYFYSLLNMHDMNVKLKGFIVTSTDDKVYMNYPLYSINSIDLRDKAVLIATHYVNYLDIDKLLDEKKNVSRFWVVPYLIQLEYGNASMSNQKRKPKDVITNSKMQYVWAAYHLAICDVIEYKTDGEGISSYKKIQQLVSNDRSTVDKRWNCFVDRIKKWNDGDDEDYSIKLTIDGEVILDGIHELSLSYYFGKKYIKCDYYNNLERERVFKQKSIYIDTEKKAKSIFTSSEYKNINEILKSINL